MKGTNLYNSIIILGSKLYRILFLDSYTKFDDAIIDDYIFVKNIQTYTKNIPQEQIKNKRELKEKLVEKSIPDKLILLYLDRSKLPVD